MHCAVYFSSWRLKLRRIKKKVGEDLTESNIAKVIKLLNPSTSEKPITKKEACDLLKISYNTQRLQSIIESHNEKLEFRATRRKQKRGRPASADEISEAVRAHLRGDPITDIASRLYRSVPFVRSIIEAVGVPTRGANAEERYAVGIIPDKCVAEEFEEGEIVWSAVDHASATILHQNKNIDYQSKYGCKCYSIYVHESSEEYEAYGPGYYSSALAYDLGGLKHLQEYNIDLKNIS